MSNDANFKEVNSPLKQKENSISYEDELKNSFYNLVTKTLSENFDFRYDWTTESDLKKRKDNDIIELAPSTNYPVSEKKSTIKEMSINSKKNIQQPINSEKEGNNIIKY